MVHQIRIRKIRSQLHTIQSLLSIPVRSATNHVEILKNFLHFFNRKRSYEKKLYQAAFFFFQAPLLHSLRPEIENSIVPSRSDNSNTVQQSDRSILSDPLFSAVFQSRFSDSLCHSLSPILSRFILS